MTNLIFWKFRKSQFAAEARAYHLFLWLLNPENLWKLNRSMAVVALLCTLVSWFAPIDQLIVLLDFAAIIVAVGTYLVVLAAKPVLKTKLEQRRTLFARCVLILVVLNPIVQFLTYLHYLT